MSTKTLKKYFGSGDAQAERHIREKVFIATVQFAEIFDFSYGNLKVVISPKGVGKSCLIEEAHSTLLDNNTLSLLISPNALDIEAVNQSSAMSSKSNECMNQIVKCISEMLLEVADDSDLVNRNYRELLKFSHEGKSTQSSPRASRLIKAISVLSPVADKISKAIMELDGYSTPSSLVQTISSIIDSENSLHIFVDDIDRAATPSLISTPDRARLDYTNCWAIIDALYQLSLAVPEAKIVVSVRSDIWYTMERQKLGSDIRDKINDIIKLKMSDGDIDKILKRRFDAAFDDLPAKDKKDPYPFFKEKELVLPGKTETVRKWTSFLVKTSRNKPRELIIFVQLLLKAAKGKKIAANDAYSIMPDYGEDVLRRAYAEFADICPSLEAVTKEVLRQQVYDYPDYLNVIKRIPSITRIEVDGKTVNGGDVSSSIEIMRVLHMANIVNPRIPDTSQRDGYSHVEFYTHPDFVSSNNLKQVQRCQWEVHPAFYSMIDRNRKEGLPPKGWRKQ